jgi:hypothetical protein
MTPSSVMALHTSPPTIFAYMGVLVLSYNEKEATLAASVQAKFQ